MSESNSSPALDPTPAEAAAALHAAEHAQSDLAADVSSPPGWDAAYGALFALILAAAAVLGASGDNLVGQIASPVMSLTAAMLTGVLVGRWRKRNGVWISGYHPGPARRVTWALVVVIGALWAAAFFAGRADAWWLVGLIVVAGMASGIVATRRWMAVYRADLAGR
ncbi:MAG: hypothetical protein Q7T55_21230 [Solirubrobacteraceae bacterium]|nr:hypothetical protein [Solirubrobacteraceae bacterium]